MTTQTTLRMLARHCGALLAVLALGACDLDVANPNAATEDDVLTTAAGLRAVAIGMQGRLGNAIEEGVWVPALVAGEIGTTNASQSTQREFQDFPDQTVNSEIDDANQELLDLWSKYYAVVKSADDIIENIGDVTMAPEMRAAMLSLARLHKAIAFGTLIEYFEEIPIATVGSDAPPFADRATVMQDVLALLASARQDITGITLPADFTNNVLAPGFDLLNTIRAMQARYSLAAGNYADALAFANEVPPAATSVIPYTTVDPNPLRLALHLTGYFGALQSFRTDAEPGDTRVNRFTTATVTNGFGGATLVGFNVYLQITDPIPVFTQDELTLIRAEAYARLTQLPEARTQVNIVRQRAGLGDLTAAQLPDQAAVLDEILRQRRYSLFLTGLRYGDLRRFGLIDQAKVPYLPYPFAERSTNPNTPANP